MQQNRTKSCRWDFGRETTWVNPRNGWKVRGSTGKLLKKIMACTYRLDRLQDASSNKYLQTSISKRARVNLNWNANRFEVSLGAFVSPELVLGFICWTCHVGAFTRHRFHKAISVASWKNVAVSRSGVCSGSCDRSWRASGASLKKQTRSHGEKSSGRLVGWTQDGKMLFDVHHRRHVMKFEEGWPGKGSVIQSTFWVTSLFTSLWPASYVTS